MSQLTSMIKCNSEDRGGTVPTINGWGETSVPGIYAAGDVAGIEEASSAMINGPHCRHCGGRETGLHNRTRERQNGRDTTSISEATP